MIAQPLGDIPGAMNPGSRDATFEGSNGDDTIVADAGDDVLIGATGAGEFRIDTRDQGGRDQIRAPDIAGEGCSITLALFRSAFHTEGGAKLASSDNAWAGL